MPVRTKVDGVKHFYDLVFGDTREQPPIRTHGHTDDGHHVRAVVLDEIDALVPFLPMIQVAIDGRRDDEVRAVFSSKFKVRIVFFFPVKKPTHRVTTTKLITSRYMMIRES